MHEIKKNKKKNAFVIYVRGHPALLYIFTLCQKHFQYTVLPRHYLDPLVSLQHPF